MRRRHFIAGLGSAAAWPAVARGQATSQMPVIGYMDSRSPEAAANQLAAFRRGLSEVGFVEGRNVVIEYRWGPNRAEEFSAELVQRRVSVIVSASLAGAAAAKAVTTTIPIVFNAGGDPVATGLVASLSRPGGNVTGVNTLGGEIEAKRFGLMRQLVPGATRFALLVDPRTTFAKSTIAETRAAAIGAQVEAFTATTKQEIDSAFANLVQWRAEAAGVRKAVGIRGGAISGNMKV
jgi:putative tryptophan/tyrosine transport system substrate-binding protein